MTHGREGSLLYIKITVCVREVVSNFEHLKGWPVMKKRSASSEKTFRTK